MLSKYLQLSFSRSVSSMIRMTGIRLVPERNFALTWSLISSHRTKIERVLPVLPDSLHSIVDIPAEWTSRSLMAKFIL